MKNTYQKPCTSWAEQLAATSQQDLTETERVMLDQHVASCPACAAARFAYTQMDSDLVTMPPIVPHLIYAEQLPARNTPLPSAALTPGEKPVPSRRVERPGKTPTPARFLEDFQEKRAASRRVRLQRMLSTLAAVFVVCGIIGSALLLFTRHSGPGVGTGIATPAHTGPLALYAALSNGTVYAMRPDSGGILWRRQLELGGQGVIGGPAVAHGVVYVGSFNGSLYALRASDGTLLWQHALGAAPNHPIAGNDTQAIYVGAGSTLYALRTSDGSVLWQRTSDAGVSGPYNLTTPVTVAAGRVYGYDRRGLFALDAADGHVLWEGNSFNGVALVIAGGKVFATVGSGEQIEVLRASDGQVLHMLSVAGNLGFDQGKLYVANQESQTLYTLRPSDERVTGQVHMACPVTASPDPLLVQNGLVYTYSWGQAQQKAWVCAMHIGNGRQVWRWTETHRIANVASLAPVDNHLYFLYTDGDFAQVELYALNTTNGARLWKYAFPSNFAYNGYFAIGR